MGRPKAKKNALEIFFARWKECRTEAFRRRELGDTRGYEIWTVRAGEIDVLAERFLGAGNRYAYDRKQRSHEYWLRTAGRAHLILKQNEVIPPTPDS